VAKLKVGEIHEESIATGTGRRNLARGFAVGNYAGGEKAQGGIPVLLKITARNVPIGEKKSTRSKLVKYADERFISGKYKVTSITRDPDMNGWIVEMVEV
jgi:hypothetical protein